jgi:hypothetical protein
MVEDVISAEILERIKTPNLSNEEINGIFLRVFPLVGETGTKSRSGCWVLTGHGNDLDIIERNTLLDAMAESHEDFGTPAERKKIAEYIKNSVSLTIAMGLPGPSAPMQDAATRGRWAGLTTSEIDVQIVRNIYQLFDEYLGRSPPTNEMLDVVNYIVKQQLRANFLQIWGKGGEFALKTKSSWESNIVKLIEKNEIWVSKKLIPMNVKNKDGSITVASKDRFYSLRPNEGEDPDFRAREGLHLIDMRDSSGIEIANLVLPVPEYTTDEGNVLPQSRSFDINNVQYPEARSRLEDYFKNVLYPGAPRETKEEQVFNLILNKIFSKTEPDVYLSDIIMLGYILKVKKLQIYDPLCRPLSNEGIRSKTRTGTLYRGTLLGADAQEFESFPREGSEKLVSKIKEKCKGTIDANGACSIMGGKTRRRKTLKKNRKSKTKKSKTRKSKTKKSKTKK